MHVNRPSPRNETETDFDEMDLESMPSGTVLIGHMDKSDDNGKNLTCTTGFHNTGPRILPLKSILKPSARRRTKSNGESPKKTKALAWKDRHGSDLIQVREYSVSEKETDDDDSISERHNSCCLLM